ncbi:MAG: HAMP domain-containing protein [Caldilineaceae bacterium]|nr:HAMP domain-containing protein [Caldilineaceae bacterium]
MRTLSTKLTLAFLLVSILGVLLMALLVDARTTSEFDLFLSRRDNDRVAQLLEEYYATYGNWDGVAGALEEAMPRLSGQILRSITILDANGRIVLGQSLPRIGRDDFLRKEFIRPLEVNGEIVGSLVLDVPPSRPHENATAEQAFRQSIRRAIMGSALGAALGALLIGTLLARTITRPVRELTAATEALAAGDLGYQVPVTGKDEIGELAGSFNRMSSDLARATRLRRQMTADIAHDLRTPLSVILGYTEALSDGKLRGSPQMYDVLHGEAQQLSRLIDDLRTLSLADAGELALNLTPLAPHRILERAQTAFSDLAAAADIALTVQVDENLPLIEVDPDRIAQVLGNLISNALRYTPAGGQITLSAAAADDAVLMSVQDTGEGIAPEDLDLIFERFYRSDQARPDNGESGLGLAIAKSIVEAHGGTIAVTSRPGTGTTFQLHMPVAAGDDSE